MQKLLLHVEMSMNFSQEDSDSSIDGYDHKKGEWITANKAKRNRKRYLKNGIGCVNNDDEKGKEQLDGEEEGGPSPPEPVGANEPASSGPSKQEEVKRTSPSTTDVATSNTANGRICRGGSLKQCGKAVPDEAEGVQCNVCFKWYHALCQTLTSVALEALKKFKGLAWICHECDTHLKSGMIGILQPSNSFDDERLTRLVYTVEQQSNKIESMTKCYKQLCCDIQTSQKHLIESTQTHLNEHQEKEKQSIQEVSFADIVKGSCDEIVSKITSTIEGMPQGMGKEALEREKRKCNVVVHNLPESQAESSKARSDEDIRNVMDIVKDELRVYARIVGAFRVGQRQRDRPRLLIVKFETEAAKWDVVRYARHLQHSHKWGNIYINPDLTKDERQAGKLLRQELDKRRKNGGKDLVIRNKRIIQVEGSDEKYRNRMGRRHDSSDGHTKGQPCHTEMVQKNEGNQTRPQDNQEALPKGFIFGLDMAESAPNHQVSGSGSCESGGNPATGSATSC